MRLLKNSITFLVQDEKCHYFYVYLVEGDKLLGFSNEQGLVYSYVLLADSCDVEPRPRTFLALTVGEPLPKIAEDCDIKFIQPLPPNHVLFETFSLKEIAKKGVSGFGFDYPGLLKDPSDLWKAIADEQQDD